MECTVVIPTIMINNLVSRIVKKTLSSDKKIKKIIIVYNDNSKILKNSKRLKLIKTKDEHKYKKKYRCLSIKN